MDNNNAYKSTTIKSNDTNSNDVGANNNVVCCSNINKDPVNRASLFCLAGSLSFVLFSAVVLSSLRTSATTSHEDQISITVPAACTMGGDVASGEEHATTLTPGTYSGNEGIGKTTLTTFCNDYNGFSIYAIGYTGNSYGDNTLLGANTDITIPTGIYTEGDTTSKWSMRVDKVTDSSQTYSPANMTITNSFDSWHNVPTTYTKVAQYKATTGSSITDNDKGAKVTTTYSAYASANQAADTYQGQVKYTMVHPYNANTPPAKSYMQDFTLNECRKNVGTNGNPANIGDNITVYDRRDESDYTVRFINGQCWMTQNLRITGTILSADSNFDRVASFNVSEYDLTDTTNCTDNGASASDPKGYSNVCSHIGVDSNNNATGWYNYAAATAGQITGYDNTNNATQDICPAGWHLPSAPNIVANTDFNILIGNTVSDWQNLTDGLNAFNVVAGGLYLNGFRDTNLGVWWSSVTIYNGLSAYNPYYDSDRNQFNVASAYRRFVGYFVRCLLSN